MKSIAPHRTREFLVDMLSFLFSARLCHGVCISAVGLVLCATAPAQETPNAREKLEPGYCRFPGSISPDGAYMLAWAPGNLSPEVRASLKEWPADKEVGWDSLSATSVGNFLFDVRQGRLLTQLPGFDFFNGQGSRKNRSELFVAWTPDSRSALAICEERWDDSGIVWIEPSERRVIDMKAAMETAFKGVLRERNGEKDDPNLQFSFPALLPNNVLVVYGYAGHGKQPPFYNYRLTLRVGFAKGKPRLTVLKAKSVPDGELNVNGSDDEALNSAYQRLRGQLGDKARVLLKKEEEAWLKFREDQPDSARESLTRRRVVELQARAEQ